MIYHDGWYYLLGTHGSCCARCRIPVTTSASDVQKMSPVHFWTTMALT